MLKKILQFFLVFTLTLGLFSFIQEEVLDSTQKYFPSFNEYIPDSYYTIKNFFQDEPKKEEVKVKTNLYAGDNYTYLLSFLRKLSKLEKEKDGIIRILHYGDSMLWSDMITSGIKDRFQKDFGDGGRGLVPITNQLSRKVLAHKNLTNESQVTWKNLDHRQFINPQLGFLGEAAIPNYSNILLKHELGDNLKVWKNVELFFRNSLERNEFNIKVNAIQGNGQFPVTIDSSKIQQKKNGQCASISMQLNAAKSLSLELTQLNQHYPFLDAINFETDSGVAYSTVSRQGIEIGDLLLSVGLLTISRI